MLQTKIFRRKDELSSHFTPLVMCGTVRVFLVDSQASEESCDNKTCRLCLFKRRRLAWEHAASFVHDSCRYTWLGMSPQPFALGCKVCASAKQKGRWSEYKVRRPIKETLKNHGKSIRHQRSLARAVANIASWPSLGTSAPKRIAIGDTLEATEPKTRALGTYVPPLLHFEAAGYGTRKPADGKIVPTMPVDEQPRQASRKRKAEVDLDRAAGDAPQEWLSRHKKVWCVAEALNASDPAAWRASPTTRGRVTFSLCSNAVIPTPWRAHEACSVWSAM